MTDDDLTRLAQRIDDLILGPLAVLTRAIAELEQLRDELQAEFDAHRSGQTRADPARRAADAGRPPLGAPDGATVATERRRSLVAFGEPIGINRQSFQS